MPLLIPRSPLTRRIAVTAVAVAVTPAVADDGRDGGAPASGSATGSPAGNGDGNGQDGRQQGDRLGRVTAERLALRTSPTRGFEVLRYDRRGETVHIHCKPPGDTVQGDPRRHLLADGTWARGAARCIENIGPAPRWC